MTDITTTTRHAATFLADLQPRIARLFAQYRTYRTTVNELSALSDRELCDLGVFRTDIRAIAQETAFRA